jgi:cell division protein FtsZ
MLFITAGMGGGTGTGAAPVVAEIAREMGILTVAVVTKPFASRASARRWPAIGIEQLKQHVDSLIIIPNDRLMQVLGEDVTYEDAFRASNDVLNGAVAGIAEVINCPGMVNVDFADVRTVMSENGVAMMGSATASGPERAQMAAEQAVHSPLLEDIHLSGRARRAGEHHREPLDEAEGGARGDEHHPLVHRRGRDRDLRQRDRRGDRGRAARDRSWRRAWAARRRSAQPVMQVVARTGTDDAVGQVNYEELDQPTAIRRRRDVTIEAMRHSGVDMLDIPAFLRKQAD